MSVILSIITINILGVYLLSKNQRKETLYIVKSDDTIHFLLSNDPYINVKIKNSDKDTIYKTIKSVIANRAFELSNIVDNVCIINGGNEAINSELLSILTNYKSSEAIN